MYSYSLVNSCSYEKDGPLMNDVLVHYGDSAEHSEQVSVLEGDIITFKSYMKKPPQTHFESPFGRHCTFPANPCEHRPARNQLVA